jgi:glutamate racemase
MNNKPIGIFDSGVGGISVLRALRNLMPHEKYLYFGDTGRVPYGSKSPEVVVDYSVQIGTFLAERGIKALVVACNSASARAGKVLEDVLDIPVMGMIGPVAREAVATTEANKIGVIGTKNTIGSNAHAQIIGSLNSKIAVYGIACPMFVPYIEEGQEGSPGLNLEIERCLNPLLADGIDTLILGCTHYPLIRTKIQSHVGDGVHLIDPGVSAANEIYGQLSEQQGLAEGGEGNLTFYVTGGVNEFQDKLARFGLPDVHIDHVEIVNLPHPTKVHMTKPYGADKPQD